MAADSGKPPLTILLLGASGLIGGEIARVLVAGGHRVVGVARNVTVVSRRMPGVEWKSLDIAQTTQSATWMEQLDGVDLVINASGALQDSPTDNTRALQVDAMTALFGACQRMQRRLVHISAAGVEEANAPFMRQKREADAILQSMDFDWVILRPGLVLSPVAYGGSAMLRAMASMPFILPVTFADRTLRCVHVGDVAHAVTLAISGQVAVRRVYDLVSEQPETFADLLSSLRAWLGLAPAPLVRLPAALVRPFFVLGDLVGVLGWRTPMRSASFNQLSTGIDGNPSNWAAASGQSLGSSTAILATIPVGVQERWFARLWLLKPVIFVTLALFWLLSGMIGAVRWDAAVEVLTARGRPQAFALLAVFGGSLADILIGLAIAFRRTARIGLLAALVVSSAYLLGAALFATDLWLDPLGPMLKVFPSIALALVALAVLEER